MANKNTALSLSNSEVLNEKQVKQTVAQRRPEVAEGFWIVSELLWHIYKKKEKEKKAVGEM